MFFEESCEGLDVMEVGLLVFELGQQDLEIINFVFCVVYLIKGGVGIFGFDVIVGLIYVLEMLLDELCVGKCLFELVVVDVMLFLVDVLWVLLCEVEYGQFVDLQVVVNVKVCLEVVLFGQVVVIVVLVVVVLVDDMLEVWQIGFVLVLLLFMSGNDLLCIICELEYLGLLQVVVCMECLFGFVQFDLFEVYLVWDFGLVGKVLCSKIEDIFVWVVDDCELDICLVVLLSLVISVLMVLVVVIVFVVLVVVVYEVEILICVVVEKVDVLINLVGELVIIQVMFKQVLYVLDLVYVEQLFVGLDLFECNICDLQEVVIGVCMLLVDVVFCCFLCLVCDLFLCLGKYVCLCIIGEGIELDKGLIEKIVDLFVYLVCNLIDYGLEMFDVCCDVGKDEIGMIIFVVLYQGGYIVIEVSDDGCGLNCDKILFKVVECGLSVLDNFIDVQVWDFIFQFGFFIVDVVMDFFGCGVGMDVVCCNIQVLGGEVQLESQVGNGICVLICLLLILVIFDGMIVLVVGEILILLLVYVFEVLQLQVEDVCMMVGEGCVLCVCGEYLLIFLFSEYYGYSGCIKDDLLVVVVEGDGQKIVLEVDELVGQQQVVVKNIENNYCWISGVFGVIILGDGCVVLIVDIGGLVCLLWMLQVV